MMDPLVVIERLTLLAPLGVRFVDAATGEIVLDGLAASAYPLGHPDSSIPAFANMSGVYAWRGLPGMRQVEHGAGDAAFWQNPPAKRTFTVQVIDLAQRFLPCSFAVEAPVKGIFTWPCGAASPPTPPLGVPLYSAPGRGAPAGMAVVRASLWDTTAQKAAAWAVAEVYSDGLLLASGMADNRGELALLFPYPEPQQFAPASPPDSPPSASRRALADQTWDLSLQVYTGGQAFPPIPDLCQVLQQRQLGPAQIWQSLSPVTPLPAQPLRFGQDLVIRSQSQSVLLLTLAGSPP